MSSLNFLGHKNSLKSVQWIRHFKLTDLVCQFSPKENMFSIVRKNRTNIFHLVRFLASFLVFSDEKTFYIFSVSLI